MLLLLLLLSMMMMTPRVMEETRVVAGWTGHKGAAEEGGSSDIGIL